MASFDDVGTTINLKELIGDIAVNTFDNLVRGVLFELMSTHVNNFNLMNYDFMNIHMIRNTYEKQITLSTIGENAYPDGNGDATATPAIYPTYTKGNNYMEFVSNTREAEKNGILTTRVQKAGEENRNLYWDADPKEIADKVEYTGRMIDRNSILYKTKKLMRQKKLKTIISEFHTKPGVEYNGQIGTKNYGESHGRNLLTKNAALGDTNYDGYNRNGYDNPYCRVWTHHYKYDQLKKTMRANSDSLDNWKGFEWNESDKGHKKDTTNYGDDENYDYAWRGKHNQDRIAAHSVLDRKTGLVKVTPQYGDTEGINRHTKDCMFSIENLAWKDYDPYSFEQALSWEQRGPFGGRIMWFPPYGIEITETATAKWQPNDFIGRGEPVYTYVNSERSGNLSFIMVTDHPSSVDYASWWDDNNETENTVNSSGNCENDYLRYFAGCANGDNGLIEATKDDPNDSKTGGLIVKPTPLTDEYLQDKGAPLIKKEKLPPPAPEPVPPEPIQEDKNPVYVEFFMFFPNNYSGVWDKPTNPNANVNAIAYLLGGENTMKEKQIDLSFDVDSPGFNYLNGATIGYEMEKSPITTSDVYESEFYIQGGMIDTTKYTPDPDKKWCYRIDHIQPYKGGNNNPKNTINQSIAKKNLQDKTNYRLNLEVNNDILNNATHKDNLYSFAEVAAALYSEDLLNQPNLYQWLIDSSVNVENVNKLIELFTNQNQQLTEILCEGAASSHGSDDRNNVLSLNRANTILNWIRTNTKCGWDKLENTWDGTSIIIPVNEGDKSNINAKSAKLGRCAHCIMTFTSSKIESNTSTTPEKIEPIPVEETRDIVGFTYIEPRMQSDGTVWHYYKKDDSVLYYDQKGSGNDNYENVETNDIVVNEQDVIDIFTNVNPTQEQSIKKNPKYRGLYNERGFYVETFDYSKNDECFIMDLSYTENKSYWKGLYVYDEGRLYTVLYGDKLNDTSYLMVKYGEGDYVLVMDGSNEIFYVCLENYVEKYPDFTFDENEWDEVTKDNISDAIVLPYEYVPFRPSEAKAKQIIYDEDEQVFKLCTSVDTINPPYSDTVNWEGIIVSEFEDGMYLYIGEYVKYMGILYICVDDTEYSEEFDIRNWEVVHERLYCNTCEYYKDEVIVYGGAYFKCKKDIKTHHFTTDLSVAMPKLIKDSDNPTGNFDGDYHYTVGDYCLNGTKYYKSLIDFTEKIVQNIPFETALEEGCWGRASDAEMNFYNYTWDLDALVNKAAAVLCCTVDEMVYNITADAKNNFNKNDESFSCIWKYGKTNNLVTTSEIYPGRNIYDYATKLEPGSRPDSGLENPPIQFTENENEYLEMIVKAEFPDDGDIDKRNARIIQLRTEIIIYRILDCINKIQDDTGVRKVCENPSETQDEMDMKTTRVDESDTAGCDNLWVDRGDGMLIQECNIKKEHDPYDLLSARKDQRQGYNKLRYDQEYHFYKHFSIEHPLLFQKLQQKLKYFNPAFHSMTPEGFNARLNFLQQCTRQGNTKTMSDVDGKTANNLAFGRPPYCILRLGDFYNQMIVIESISYDYNISDGLQWDLNPEGNGVQPMLCKVNISFKFIGGGDITGPVQRLQNAMSFNYYANTSFYDNRADRIEYQPTNWKTMGGAGNDQIDMKKSYAYIAQNYEANPELNIFTPDLTHK